ncbi:MAG TPA: glycosyltransferase family 9 protein [Ktedonobacterales bacterium]|nr:glycosyltransferase family 9 protein [Ktedonobacterales bacterium]
MREAISRNGRTEPLAPFALGRVPHVRLPATARILVVRAAGIGDLLLAVPALRALRETLPRATLDVLVTPAAAPLLRDSPLVDRVIPFDKAAWDYATDWLRAPRRLASLPRLWRTLRAGRYDAALVMHHQTLRFGRLKYRALLAAVRPAVAVGLDNGLAPFFDVAVADHGFGARHEAEYALDLAAAALDSEPPPLMGATLANLGWGDLATEMRQARPPLVVLHPGSGTYSLARRWPVSRFAAVARSLRQEFGAEVTVVGTAEDEAVSRELVRLLEAPPWLTCQPTGASLRAAAALLARASLFVGNDSLPMHLAAAAGTPIVAIFGPSNHRAWAPLPAANGGPAVIVRRDLTCSPCFYRGQTLGTPQGCPPRPCLTELDVPIVLRHARALLGDAARQPLLPGG